MGFLYLSSSNAFSNLRGVHNYTRTYAKTPTHNQYINILTQHITETTTRPHSADCFSTHNFSYELNPYYINPTFNALMSSSDFQTLESLSKSISSNKSTIFFSRHAKTEESTNGIIQGVSTQSKIIPLESELFLKLGREFASEHPSQKFVIAHSPLERTTQTAEIFGAGITAQGTTPEYLSSDVLKDVQTGLEGLNMKDPEVVKKLKAFKENPLIFSNGQENGYKILYSILSFIQGLYTTHSASIRYDEPSSFAIFTHQVPMKLVLYAIEKQVVSGLTMVKSVAEDSYILELDHNKFSRSLLDLPDKISITAEKKRNSGASLFK